MSGYILYRLVDVLPLWSFRILSLVIGYCIVRIGYKLILSGVKGEFKFSSDFKGIKAGLVGSSPGLLFLLLGVLLMISAVMDSEKLPNTSFGNGSPVESGSSYEELAPPGSPPD